MLVKNILFKFALDQHDLYGSDEVFFFFFVFSISNNNRLHQKLLEEIYKD